MSLNIRPFRALRAKNHLVKKVVMPAFDNLNAEDISKIIKNSKWNFLNVISPEAFYPGISKKLSKKHSLDHLSAMIDEKIIFQEEKESFYIYQLEKYNKSQFGIVASIDINKKNPMILKHEKTLDARCDRILRTTRNTNIQVGPVYFSHKSKTNLSSIYNRYKKIKPLYNFQTSGGTIHSLWKVDKDKDIKLIEENLKKIDKLYIADGHHRFSSMEKLYTQYGNKNKIKKCIPLLSVIFDKNNINILSYNKVIKFKKWNYDQFILLLKKQFNKFEISNFKQPSKRGEVSIYCNNKWHNLNIRKNNILKKSKKTDSEIIENLVLKNILLKKMELKIVEKTHVPGKFGAQFLEEKVDLTIADVAFFICPMTMHEIMSVADAGKIVPPKSTFFDPKPIDGLVTLLMKE
tara:strand:- start:5372 stop:6586 length:1215 start_codon:yes stop_codon:yes gene_type:complete